jgi:hypothetical protein
MALSRRLHLYKRRKIFCKDVDNFINDIMGFAVVFRKCNVKMKRVRDFYIQGSRERIPA